MLLLRVSAATACHHQGVQVAVVWYIAVSALGGFGADMCSLSLFRITLHRHMLVLTPTQFSHAMSSTIVLLQS